MHRPIRAVARHRHRRRRAGLRHDGTLRRPENGIADHDPRLGSDVGGRRVEGPGMHEDNVSGTPGQLDDANFHSIEHDSLLHEALDSIVGFTAREQGAKPAARLRERCTNFWRTSSPGVARGNETFHQPMGALHGKRSAPMRSDRGDERQNPYASKHVCGSPGGKIQVPLAARHVPLMSIARKGDQRRSPMFALRPCATTEHLIKCARNRWRRDLIESARLGQSLKTSRPLDLPGIGPIAVDPMFSGEQIPDALTHSLRGGLGKRATETHITALLELDGLVFREHYR
jgi:hypothetical protein